MQEYERQYFSCMNNIIIYYQQIKHEKGRKCEILITAFLQLTKYVMMMDSILLF